MFFCAVNSEILTVNIPGMHFYSLFLYYYPRDAILDLNCGEQLRLFYGNDTPCLSLLIGSYIGTV